MKFRLEIECDNAAFGDGDADRGYELGRILTELGERMYSWSPISGAVRDGNGNIVGMFHLEEN